MSSMDDSKLDEVSTASESSSNSTPPEESESCDRLNQILFEWAGESGAEEFACVASELLHDKSNKDATYTYELINFIHSTH